MRHVWIILLAVLIALPSAIAYDEYTPSSETHCSFGICTATLYSGVRYVYEDSVWKLVEDARSLKDVWTQIYVENDTPNYDIVFTDYNYTYVVGTLWVKTKTSIPFRVCLNETYCRSYNVMFAQNQYSFIFDFANDRISVNGIDINFASISDRNPLSIYNWTLGSSSTTVQLQDAGSENLEDTYVNSSNPDYNRGTYSTAYVRANDFTYMKFNISSIPAGSLIANATLSLTSTGSTGDFYVHHCYNQTWTEETITWNDQPCNSTFDSSKCNSTYESYSSYSAALKYHTMMVLNMFKTDFGLGNSNFSIAVNSTYTPLWRPIATKESSTTYNPYLNVTYVIGYPRWYVNQSSIVSTYGMSDSSKFNVTWNVTTGTDISNVLLESNCTGIPTNYTMTNATYGGSIYNFSIVMPVCANAYWKSYANNTENDWNASDTWYFTISQNSTNPMHVTVGSTTDGNAAYESDDSVTISCSMGYSDGGSCSLYVDSSSVSSPYTNTFGVGSHTVLSNTSGNANYTANATGISVTLSVTAPAQPGGGGSTASRERLYPNATIVYVCDKGYSYDNLTGLCELLPLGQGEIPPIFDWESAFLNPIIGPVSIFHLVLGGVTVYALAATRKTRYNKYLFIITLIVIGALALYMFSPSISSLEMPDSVGIVGSISDSISTIAGHIEETKLPWDIGR